jgi:hypothetical protein
MRIYDTRDGPLGIGKEARKGEREAGRIRREANEHGLSGLTRARGIALVHDTVFDSARCQKNIVLGAVRSHTAPQRRTYASFNGTIVRHGAAGNDSLERCSFAEKNCGVTSRDFVRVAGTVGVPHWIDVDAQRIGAAGVRTVVAAFVAVS